MPELNWDGKSDALELAKNIPARLLEFDDELSFGDGKNLIVQGDNLVALKSLLPFYRAQVKCVYIDPPYNTGAAFEHYDDNFPHAQWLSMMYPRLKLLREFLSDDGSIWISIDDDEAHYLKVLCDEIFGRNNFVASVVWEKKYSPQNDAKWLSDSHDFILVYARDKNIWRPNLLPRTAEMDARYKNPDNDPRGVWKAGDISAKRLTPKDCYPITTPSGRVVYPPEGTSWRFTQEKFAELVADNRIWFGANGNNVPAVKRFLSDVLSGSVSKTIWFRDEVGDNQEAKREVKALNFVFDTPKPERLIQRILTLATNAGDLVMDCFLGSGTTAAVAHKMNRRYIGVEVGEHAITHVVPRLQKVIGGEQGGISKSVDWTGGGGFKFCRLGEEFLNADGTLNPAVTFERIAEIIWFAETGQSLDEKFSPLIGVHDGRAIYLLFGDENILTTETFLTLPTYKGTKIIYASACRLSERFLREHEIIFRHVPIDLKI
ncbi:MAG: site-specific DNA-methyltransferase [Selenomonadaceae bacterium]|nr:site-specific DNA-methyltransferase [Selenomonadaceae bacterium]